MKHTFFLGISVEKGVPAHVCAPFLEVTETPLFAQINVFGAWAVARIETHNSGGGLPENSGVCVPPPPPGNYPENFLA